MNDPDDLPPPPPTHRWEPLTDADGPVCDRDDVPIWTLVPVETDR